MSLSSTNLDAFHAVAQTGNFTRAAKALHVTQSALSQRVLNLERELETALFIRDRAGIKLTVAGQELIRFCSAKSALENESMSAIRFGKGAPLSGYIRIGGFSSVMRSVILPGLAPLIRQSAEVQLTFVSKEMDELPDLLRSGAIDYMVLHYELVRDELERLVLGQEKNIHVEKKGYNGPDVYLDHDEKDQITSRYFHLAKVKNRRFKRRYLDDVYGLIDGVRNGIGRAIIPRHLVKNDAEFKILNPSVILKVPVVIHFYRQPYYTRLHGEVIRQLQSVCPALLE